MICYFNLFIQKYCLIFMNLYDIGENDPVSYKTPTNFDICGCFSKKVLLIRPFDNIMSTALQKNGRNKHILYLFRPTYFILPDRLQKHLHLSTYITPALFSNSSITIFNALILHTVYPLTLRYARAHMSYWFSGSSH